MSEVAPALMVVEYHRGHRVTPRNGDSSFNSARQSASCSTMGLRSARSLISSTMSVLRAAFLPEGFPESVSPDYIGFQAWDTVQALCSYVRGMLTSAAILRGVGVGQQASSPLAAVFTFFLRDMAGMLGGILFAYLQGSGFDSCAKQWRLFADVTNDLGMTLELATPHLPRAAFLPLACAGSIARSVTGVAGGATRAALTQHFARLGNAADVSAKEQSQETATTILGMLAGMAVTRALGPASSMHPTSSPAAEEDAAASTATYAAIAAWLVFVLLTVVHVAANVAALRCLRLTSLNQPRLELLVRRYLVDGRVLSPDEVGAAEDLTPPPFRSMWDLLTGAARRRQVVLHFGSRLTALVGQTQQMVTKDDSNGRQQDPPTTSLEQILKRQGHRPYLLLLPLPPPAHYPAGGSLKRPRLHLHLVLHRSTTTSSSASSEPEHNRQPLLPAFVHMHCLAWRLEVRLRSGGEAAGSGVRGRKQRAVGAAGSHSTGVGEPLSVVVAAAERDAEVWMTEHYDNMVRELVAAGWDIDRVTLPRPAWTVEWALGGAGIGKEE